MKKKFHILILNGPNINLLGNRETKIYGTTSLKQIVDQLIIKGKKNNIQISHFQSNAEYKIIEKIHNAKIENINYILLNPAALTHTSIALRDALIAVNIPFIEVHITNIFSREKFRHHSFFSDISSGIICGLGTDGYLLALESVIRKLSI
ncbi:type II 3-dehydroquinate dehydratase [Candidatus Tachikawaea gelatinosa]|uniref:3-dehydroquinate dehydratase n=1 Tax=Candidatus Tachikawaea gelatinosa TaxID=1410383 RepID=A0A090AQR9_9ENTR|nr:type II 3-dehydroquinate dehydratase [Candidatus Tachikawaea gelatinosa]BAP58692.1 3-dehydroquinate dehydratase [Candidatus Tachikawaea gelatinosa]